MNIYPYVADIDDAFVDDGANAKTMNSSVIISHRIFEHSPRMVGIIGVG